MPSLIDTENLLTDFNTEIRRRDTFETYEKARKQMSDPERFQRKTARSLALSDLGYRSSDVRSGAAKLDFIKRFNIQLPEGAGDDEFDAALTDFVKKGAKDERDNQEIFTQELDAAVGEGAPPRRVYAYAKHRGMQQAAQSMIANLSPMERQFLSNLGRVSQDKSMFFIESGAGTEESGPSPLAKLQEAWVTMTPAERGRVGGLAPIVMGKALERAPEGELGFFGGIGRGARGFLEGIGSFISRRGRDIRIAQGQDPVQADTEDELFSMLSQLRGSFEGKRDPREGLDWGKVRETLGGSAAEMGAIAGSLPFYAMAKGGQHEMEDIFANPYASRGSRMVRGLAAGYAEGALARVQLSLLKVKAGSMASLLGKGTVRNAAARFAVGTAGTVAGEGAIEAVQEFSPEIVNQIAHSIGVDGVNKPDFAAKWGAIQEDLPEIGMAFLLMSAVSSGAKVTMEMRNSKILGWQTKTPEVMQMMGLDPQRSIEIAGIENDVDRVNAFVSAAQEHHKAVEAGKAEAKPVITPEMRDGARKAILEQMGHESEGSTVPVFVPMPDGTIDVQMPDGQSINVDNSEQAFAAAQNVMRESAEGRQSAMEAMLGEEGKGFEEQLNNAELARIQAAHPELEITAQQAASLRGEVDAGSLPLDTATRRIQDYAFQEASALSGEGQEIDPDQLAEKYVEAFLGGELDFTIGGSAVGAGARIKNGLLHAAITLDPKKGLRTLWEEAGEAHMHGMLNSGLMTEAQLEGLLREFEGQTGRKILSGTKRENLIEGWSYVVRAYATGDLKQARFTGRLRHMIDALIATFLDIVGLARDITRLRKDGKLNPELEANIKAALGIESSAFYQAKQAEAHAEVDPDLATLENLPPMQGDTLSIAAREKDPNLGFYSALQRALEQRMPEKASAQQIMGVLNPSKGSGVKQAEIDWLGIEAWLGDRKSVAKEDVLRFVEENKVRLSENIAGGGEKWRVSMSDGTAREFSSLEEARHELDAERDWVNEESVTVGFEEGHMEATDFNGDTLASYSLDDDGTWSNDEDGDESGLSEEDAQELVERAAERYRESFGLSEEPERVEGEEDYSSYTQPGGENYREILLQLGDGGGYTSGHFSDYKDIAVWIRAKDRDAGGRRALHIEEVQSDWAGDIRKHGTRSAEEMGRLRDQLAAAQKQSDDIQRRVNKIAYDLRALPARTVNDLSIYTLGKSWSSELSEDDQATVNNLWKEQSDARRDTKEAYDELHRKESDLRRQQAIADNQVRDLRTKLAAAEVAPPPMPFVSTYHELAAKRALRIAVEQGYDMLAWSTGEQQIDLYTEQLRQNVSEIVWDKTIGNDVLVVGKGLDGTVVFDELIPIEGKGRVRGTETDLEGVVGKEIATQIRESKESKGSVSGEGLSIGGHFHRLMYDTMIPSFLKKFTKKWGGEVSDVTADGLVVHGMEITDEMRESASEGYPTFSITPSRGYNSRITDKGVSYWKTYGGRAFVEVTVPFGGTAVNVDTIMADSATRGTAILVDLRSRFPDHTIHVHGAVDSAVGFYRKMQERGLIDSWTQGDELRTFSLQLDAMHGTNQVFDRFDMSRAGSTWRGVAAHYADRGGHFTLDREFAASYAYAAFDNAGRSGTPVIVHASLRIENPLTWEDVTEELSRQLSRRDVAFGFGETDRAFYRQMLDRGDSPSQAASKVALYSDDRIGFYDKHHKVLWDMADRMGKDAITLGSSVLALDDASKINIRRVEALPPDTFSIEPEGGGLLGEAARRAQEAGTPHQEEVYLQMMVNLERVEARQRTRKSREAFARSRVKRVPVEAAGALLNGEIDGWRDADGNRHELTPAELAELRRSMPETVGGNQKFITVRTFADVDPARDRAMLEDLAAYDAMLAALPPEVRGRLGGWTKLASLPTHEARIRYLDTKLAALDKHLDRHLGNKFRDDIRKMFKVNKVKKVGGIPRGKGAKFHEDLTRIQGITEMGRDAVRLEEQRLEQALSATQDPDLIESLSGDLVELFAFGNIFPSGKNRRNAKDLYQAREQLRAVIKTGMTRWRAVQESRAAQNKENVEHLLADITGGEGLLSQSQQKREKAGPILDRAQEFAAKSMSWEWMLNRATSASGERALQNRSVKKWGRAIHRATHAERRRNWKETEEMSRALAAIFGVTTRGNWRFRLSKKLEAFREERETGVFKLEFVASEKKIVLPLEKAKQILAGEADYKAFDLLRQDLDALQTLVDEQLQKKRPGTTVELMRRTVAPTHELKLSQDQALYLTMLWSQEGMQSPMRHWGWDEDAIAGLEEFVGPEGRNIREFLRAKYDTNWGELNAVYAKRFGINMPQIKNYSPARFIHDGKADEAEMMLEETVPGASVTPGFAKMRVNHIAQPREDVGALQVYVEHMRQSSHFIAWADTVADTRSAFLNKDVQTALEQRGGRWLRSMINERLEFFADGGSRVKSWRALDWLRKKFTVLALAYNWGVMLKQLTSQPAFLFDMDAGEFLRYQAKFFRSPRKAWKFMSGLDFVKERMTTGFDRDVQLVLNSVHSKSRGGITAALEYGMITGRAGDIVPVIVGGWCRYQSTYDKARSRGQTHETAHADALIEMEMSVERAQQAGDVKDLSHFQQGGSAARLFTMFLTSPLQYYMNTYNAVANVGAPGGKKDLAKRIIVSHILLPFAFQFVSDLVRNVRNLTDDDDETGLLDLNPLDYVRAMLLGPLNGLFVVGHGLSAVSGYAVNALADLVNTGREEDEKMEKVKVWGYKSPVIELMEDSGVGLKDAQEGLSDLMEDPSLDDFAEIAHGIAEAAKVTPLGGAYDVGYRLTRSLGLNDEIGDAMRPKKEKLADSLRKAKADIYDLDKEERGKLGKVTRDDPDYGLARMRIREIDATRYEELAEIIVKTLKPYSNEEITGALDELGEGYFPKAVQRRAFPELDFTPTTE